MKLDPRLWIAAPVAALLVALGWFLVERALDPDGREVAVATEIASGGLPAPAEIDRTPRGIDPRDADIIEERLVWAHAQRLDTLTLGPIVAQLGQTFLGTDYVPYVLEQPGPERLVINLRDLDCVTFVENVLVLARMVRAGQADLETFSTELRNLRYRDGVIEGYASRLHYFSEWIADAERKGYVRNVTRELGGVPDTQPLHFMSSHRDAYRQLADPQTLAAIREIEQRLSEQVRYYIPEERIADVAPHIRNGDIIAATSALDGLDVAHTGIALWVEGRLHLMHAPLVGSSVEISELPLAERLLAIDGQDGIMVARPL